MKCLIACLAVLFMVTPAMAGMDPYIAVVGNDIDANPFYLDAQYQQFLYDQNAIGVPVVGEQFDTNVPIIYPEVCDTSGTAAEGNIPPFIDRGNPNARVTAYNPGWYEWTVNLPKKPVGEINLCIQCGILKPNSFGFYGFDAVRLCAAETGERIGLGPCVREEVGPGVNPVIRYALPRITATASPGPYATVTFTPFSLTAYKNPGTYDLAFDASTGAILNNAASQVLDGSDDTRILLKSCMDKCIVVKLPVSGQANALGQVEQDLEVGDIIRVRMYIPLSNTVDIYCHQESLKIMGIASNVATKPTPSGNTITTSLDTGNGTTTAITFPSVSSAGYTSATISTDGPKPPAGLQFGNPPIYYDISTTATYTPPVTVCITYDPKQYTDPSTARLLHWENGEWMDVTTSHDVANHNICGQVNSLSPFAIMELDKIPPVITSASANPSVLWPANHKMVDVTVSYNVDDNSTSKSNIKCDLSVKSNEPINGTGDGDTAPDWVIVDSNHVKLRAERAGYGKGRVYTITITCTDGTGNSSSQTVAVSVPRDQRK